ncbi:methyl-accepting chemotaxis protein [Massilia horti]|uniref:Methyl-accepting chemotaxis protein n=1 Tax=Massilia horti TaxID=2562153 RepID=A0A4Y9T4J2_9BURK|nr:methyl-accepting chemotaxis protein [Massilia horti]TFW34557.1 methyl-accepting chemotaxis protein [Massilia horti]
MKWFHDLLLSTKLALGFISVLALTTLVGVVSIIQLERVNATGTDIATNWMPSVRVVLELKANFARHRSQIGQHLLSENEASMARYEQKMAEYEAAIKKNQQTYIPLITSPEEKAEYDHFVQMWTRYQSIVPQIIRLSRAHQDAEAKAALRGESSQLTADISNSIDKLVDINNEGARQANLHGDDLYESSRTLLITLLITCMAIGAAAAFLLVRLLTRQLGGDPKHVAAIAGKIAAGDLAVDVRPTSNDPGSVMHAIRDMRDSLASIVTEVRVGTETIVTASTQIASGNLDLSSRTEEQASSLEETASSMEELTSTVKQNADNAHQANQLAVSASEVASRGGMVVSQVVETMGSINDSSKKIVDIIGVIDGIAFQTNILALNAAVEAARAGEQGRGFAVVASEVRTLAQRSAAAAKEIKGLIDNSVEKVDAGSKLVDQAGSTMQEIVQSIGRVTNIMGDISAATREQTAGIEQVNQAISEMDHVTQQNAALVEEASAASQTMQDQAANLERIVSVFKLDGVQHAKAQPVTRQVAQPVAALAPRKAAPAKIAAVTKRPTASANAGAGSDGWEEF